MNTKIRASTLVLALIVVHHGVADKVEAESKHHRALATELIAENEQKEKTEIADAESDTGNILAPRHFPHYCQLGFVITDRKLPDSSLTASSEYDSRHSAKRARMDNYLDYPCAWSA